MDETTFDVSLVGTARLIYFTGVTVARAKGCSRLLETIVAHENELKIPITFDVNYRALLWSHKKCRRKLTPLLSKIDTMIVTQRDLSAIFEISGNAASA